MDYTNAIRSLTEDNREEVKAYLKFFKNKQEALQRSLTYELNELQSNRLTEEVYSKEDVEEYHHLLSNTMKVR